MKATSPMQQLLAQRRVPVLEQKLTSMVSTDVPFETTEPSPEPGPQQTDAPTAPGDQALALLLQGIHQKLGAIQGVHQKLNSIHTDIARLHAVATRSQKAI